MVAMFLVRLRSTTARLACCYVVLMLAATASNHATSRSTSPFQKCHLAPSNGTRSLAIAIEVIHVLSYVHARVRHTGTADHFLGELLFASPLERDADVDLDLRREAPAETRDAVGDHAAADVHARFDVAFAAEVPLRELLTEERRLRRHCVLHHPRSVHDARHELEPLVAEVPAGILRSSRGLLAHATSPAHGDYLVVEVTVVVVDIHPVSAVVSPDSSSTHCCTATTITTATTAISAATTARASVPIRAATNVTASHIPIV